MPGTRDQPTVAVLGQGSIGRRHARLLVELGCDVVVHDPAASGAVVAGTRWADDEAQALNGANGAIVASPTSEHLAQARRVVDAGCHVLVEKPLAVTAEGVDELLDAARMAGVAVVVAMNLRHHPGPAGVHAAVTGGEIGIPLIGQVTCGTYLPDWRPHVDYRESYSARRELGGGVLLDVVHEVDYACWILGPACEVSAWMGRVSDLEIDVEDVALLHLRHEGTAVSSIALDYLDRSYRRGCRIVGSEASVEWSWPDERIRVLHPDGRVEERSAPSAVDPAYSAQLSAFVAVAEGGGREAVARGNLVSGDDAARTMRLLDAARESARDGRRVTLSGS
jgi:predicted dehydrogenase